MGGSTSGSSCNPSASAFVPLKKSTTANTSTMALSSKPSRFTAAVWELIQYSQPFVAETARAMISFVRRSSFPLSMMALYRFQVASR